MSEKKEFLEGRKPVTFVDLFAGAGGISEVVLSEEKRVKEILYSGDYREDYARANCYNPI